MKLENFHNLLYTNAEIKLKQLKNEQVLLQLTIHFNSKLEIADD
jgi:hypothetical protein